VVARFVTALVHELVQRGERLSALGRGADRFYALSSDASSLGGVVAVTKELQTEAEVQRATRGRISQDDGTSRSSELQRLGLLEEVRRLLTLPEQADGI
jgi:hypothetical protein